MGLGANMVDFDFDVTRDEFILKNGKNQVWYYDDYHKANDSVGNRGLAKELADKILSDPEVAERWRKWSKSNA